MERVASQETTHRLVADYIAACNAHDIDRVTSLFAEDGSYGEFGQGPSSFSGRTSAVTSRLSFQPCPNSLYTLAAQPLLRGCRRHGCARPSRQRG